MADGLARIPDRTTLAAYGAMLAALIAGFGGGVAATLQFAPAHAEPVARLCEFPAALPDASAPQGDGIGFRILLEAAKRRGAAGHA